MIRDQDRDPLATGGYEPANALPTMPATTTFRGSIAEGTDGESIRRLASLSGSAPPQGTVLLAERNGDPVAAIGLADGQAVADPERSTFALLTRLHLERLYVRLVVSIWGL